MTKLNRLPARLTPLDPVRKGWTSEGRPSAEERGYGSEWRKVRNLVMVRDHGLCVPCRKAGRVTLAREVDHIVNKARGGGDNVENLQAICLPCHKAKTAAEAQGLEWCADAA
jgi:5-methylcytosine-specific restriction protein A